MTESEFPFQVFSNDWVGNLLASIFRMSIELGIIILVSSFLSSIFSLILGLFPNSGTTSSLLFLFVSASANASQIIKLGMAIAAVTLVVSLFSSYVRPPYYNTQPEFDTIYLKCVVVLCAISFLSFLLLSSFELAAILQSTELNKIPVENTIDLSGPALAIYQLIFGFVSSYDLITISESGNTYSLFRSLSVLSYTIFLINISHLCVESLWNGGLSGWKKFTIRYEKENMGYLWRWILHSVYNLLNFEEKCNDCGEVVQPDTCNNLSELALSFSLGFFGYFMATSVIIAIVGVGGFVIPAFIISIGLCMGYKLERIESKMRDGPFCPECGSEYDVTDLFSF